MPAKSEEPLTRLCLRLRTDDLTDLTLLSEASGNPINKLVREIVHSYVVQLRDKRRQNLDQLREAAQ